MNKTLTPIGDCPKGARVRKLDAIPFDFAYGRIGTVHRQEFSDGWKSGVLWDGGGSVIAYPSDQLLEFDREATAMEVIDK